MDGEDSLGAPASSVYECHSRGIVDTLNDFLIKLKCNWMTHKELRLWTPHDYRVLKQSLVDEQDFRLSKTDYRLFWELGKE